MMADAKKIIDIVEGCICHIPDACFMLCPHVADDATEDCMENLLRDALEVMKSQQAEIERLKAEIEKAREEGFLAGQNNMLEAQAEGR